MIKHHNRNHQTVHTWAHEATPTRPPHVPPSTGHTGTVGRGAGALGDRGHGRVQVLDLVHAECTVADGFPGVGQ